MFSSTARYSRASSVTASVAAPSLTGSTWTHRAWPVPGTPVPIAARSRPRTIMAGGPPGISPRSTISATTPTTA